MVANAVTVAARTAQSAVDTATRVIVSLWRKTDPYDERSVARFLAQSGRTVVAAQRAASSTAVAAQLTQLRAVGIDTKVAVSIPDAVRGAVELGPKKVVVRAVPKATVEYQPAVSVVVHGEPPIPAEPVRVVVQGEDAAPHRVFNRAVVTYRYQRSEGADHATASGLAEERIASIVDGNVTLAQRLGEQQALAQVHAIDERVIGWRRIIHPELSKGGVCGLCVAASDRVYNVKTLKPIHDRCRCSISPVTKANDPGKRLNAADLSRLYDDADKATTAAALKRVRYSLDHHNEMGPVLVRVKGEQVPYYSTAA